MSHTKSRISKMMPYNTSHSTQIEENPTFVPVTPSAKFPCFGCFDRPVDRLMCQICDKKGYVTGDHPMVKFVDQFLSTNLPAKMKRDLSSGFEDSEQGSYTSEDSQDLKNFKSTGARKKAQSSQGSYPIPILAPSKQIDIKQSGSLKSSSLQKSNSIPLLKHIGYSCDLCECDPIAGVRYHCETCDDFDICESCHQEHSHKHPLKPIHKEMTESLMHTSQVLNTLKQSVRVRR